MMSDVGKFEPDEFIKAFAASLVIEGWASLHPESPHHRVAFHKIWIHLDNESRRARWNAPATWFSSLLKIRDLFNPGPRNQLRNLHVACSRSDDGFATLMSNGTIKLTISPEDARHYLKSISMGKSMLAETAVDIFKNSTPSPMMGRAENENLSAITPW